MLVSGPSGQRVTVPAGSARSVSMRKSTACCGLERHDAGRAVADAVEAGLAVDMLGGDELALERRVAAGEDAGVGRPASSQMIAGVASR